MTTTQIILSLVLLPTTDTGQPNKNWAQHTVKEVINVPIEDIWQLAQTLSLEEMVVKGYDDLPKITHTKMMQGDWTNAGDYRIVYFSTGDTAIETLIQYSSPTSFAYQITNFTLPLKRVAKKAQGIFTYTDIGSGKTAVEWTYYFEQKNFIAKMLINRYIKKTHRYWMKDIISLTKEKIELKYSNRK